MLLLLLLSFVFVVAAVVVVATVVAASVIGRTGKEKLTELGRRHRAIANIFCWQHLMVLQQYSESRFDE